MWNNSTCKAGKHSPAIFCDGMVRSKLRKTCCMKLFLRLMRQTERCFGASSPRGYLFGIARHVSTDTWRRVKPDIEIPAPAEPDARLAVARETIAGLPALQREILDLRFRSEE